MSTSDSSTFLPVSDETGFSVVEEEFFEDEDSDEDYSSIQRPAFMVTGEPNFDSGPPQDGLEYLRRVRYYFQLLRIAIHVNVCLVVERSLV